MSIEIHCWLNHWTIPPRKSESKHNQTQPQPTSVDSQEWLGIQGSLYIIIYIHMWGPTPQRPLKLRTSKTFDQLELRFGKFPHELPFEVRPSEVVTNRLHRSSPTVLQPPTPRPISYWQHAHTATWAIILGKQTPWQQNNYQRLHVTHTARMLPQKLKPS